MRIFVYGTLKNNYSNHSVLNKIKKNFFYQNVETINKYPLYKLDEYFPYLDDSKGIGNIIKGQLFEIKDDKEYILDEFEGVPDLFKKGKIDVVNTQNNIVYNNIDVYFSALPLKNYDNVKLISEWKENIKNIIFPQ